MAQGTNLIVQLGLETSYGTAVTPTVLLPVTSLQINPDFRKISSKALLGNRFVHQVTNGDYAIGGSFAVEVDPDSFPILLYLLNGVEDAAATVSSGVYSHTMKPVTGRGTKLPSFSLTVDYGVDMFRFTGLKVDNIAFSVDPDNYLIATVNVKGQQISAPGAITAADFASLSAPTKKPYLYKYTTVKLASHTTSPVALADVISFNPTQNNNLEDMRQRMDGNAYGAEPDYQLGELTAECEVDYTTATALIRNTNFIGDTQVALHAIYQHDSVVTGTYFYQIDLDIPLAEIMTAPLNVTGPERERFTFTFRALQGAVTYPVTWTLQDAHTTKWSA